MPENNLPHIKIEGYGEIFEYISPRSGGPSSYITPRRRDVHGTILKNKIEEVISDFTDTKITELPSELIREDSIYLEFEVNEHFTAFDSLDSENGWFKVLNIVKKKNEQDEIIYLVSIVSTERGLSKLLQKFQQYLDPALDRNKKPKNEKLIANIENIKRASVKSLWADSERHFPNDDGKYWWELWIRRKNYIEDIQEDDKVIEQGSKVGIQFNNNRLLFPEHIVRLCYATVEELASSLMYLDNISELRKPHTASEFFTQITLEEQIDWIDELLERREISFADNDIHICLLDSGINNGHPLLEDIIPDNNLTSYDPSWGNADSFPSGHGTQMSGLLLYGDLFEILANSNRFEIRNGIESIKIVQYNVNNEPSSYGYVTIQGISNIMIQNPDRKRIFCMSVTSDQSNV